MRQLSKFQHALLHWFADNQRPLPWRIRYDPYEIWISEIMLQQTRVTTVIPYFLRWMETFPQVASVTEAEESQLMKLWEGLGYYSRVRNIQKAARVIQEQYDGKFPEQFKDILALPGIGRYTAGAIASIAFQQSQPVVDGNVIRILCRLLAYAHSPKTAQAQALLWHIAEAWIPAKKARDFNQAMMELGATVCFSQNPTCLFCPVSSWCEARRLGKLGNIPWRKPRKKVIPVEKAILILVCAGKVLLRKQEEAGLMKGLWLFPELVLSQNKKIQDQLLQHWQKQRNLHPKIMQQLPTVTHHYTAFRATLHGFLGQLSLLKELSLQTNEEWVPFTKLPDYAMPSAHGKLRTAVLDTLQ